MNFLLKSECGSLNSKKVSTICDALVWFTKAIRQISNRPLGDPFKDNNITIGAHHSVHTVHFVCENVIIDSFSKMVQFVQSTGHYIHDHTDHRLYAL